MTTLSVDVGGTFTDCCTPEGIVGKAPTTQHDLSQGFFDSLDAAAQSLGKSIEELLTEADSVRYSTTVGTNTLI